MLVESPQATVPTPVKSTASWAAPRLPSTFAKRPYNGVKVAVASRYLMFLLSMRVGREGLKSYDVPSQLAWWDFWNSEDIEGSTGRNRKNIKQWKVFTRTCRNQRHYCKYEVTTSPMNETHDKLTVYRLRFSKCKRMWHAMIRNHTERNVAIHIPARIPYLMDLDISWGPRRDLERELLRANRGSRSGIVMKCKNQK